jgi:hypothetical protein
MLGAGNVELLATPAIEDSALAVLAYLFPIVVYGSEERVKLIRQLLLGCHNFILARLLAGDVELFIQYSEWTPSGCVIDVLDLTRERLVFDVNGPPILEVSLEQELDGRLTAGGAMKQEEPIRGRAIFTQVREGRAQRGRLASHHSIEGSHMIEPTCLT